MVLGEVIFDNGERVFVNRLSNGENLNKLSKDKILSMVMFQKNILSDESDGEIKELVDGVFSKINLMTDEEWEETKKHLPLACLDEDIYDESGLA